MIDGVEQRELDGKSLVTTFDDPDAPTRTTQYFEMLGCRAIHHDGWKAVTFKPMGRMYSEDDDPDAPFEDDVWELYHVAEDFSECHDLAAEHPDKLRELIDVWWREAERNQVLPLDNRPYIAIMEPGPTGIPHRDRFVYRRSGSRVPEEVAADVKGRSHTIEAFVEIPDGGANGVLLAMGSILGGFSLYVDDDRLQYVHNYLGRDEHHVSSPDAIPSGSRTLGFAFDAEGRFKGGQARLLIDSEVVAKAEIPRYTPVRWSITDAGLTCGEDAGSQVTPRYRGRFPFTGTLHRVVVTVLGEESSDPEAKVERALRTQ